MAVNGMLEARSRVSKHSKAWDGETGIGDLINHAEELDFFPKSVQNDLSFTQWSGMIRYVKCTEKSCTYFVYTSGWNCGKAPERHCLWNPRYLSLECENFSSTENR